MAPIIKVKNLRKVYKIGKERVIALNNINIELEEGEVVSIVGPSGSGKSTLLNQLAGLEKPTKGDVYIGKNNISKMSENELAVFRQKYLGFVFQSYNLLPALTAAENVALPMVFKGVGKKEREKEAKKELDRVGLLDRANHKPTEMSGGQQQRVGIARAFIGTPKVVFADEPTGNLDSKTTQTVLAGMLASAKERAITFVMVTHDPGIAAVADRVITIIDGEIISDIRNENPGFVPSVALQYAAEYSVVPAEEHHEKVAEQSLTAANATEEKQNTTVEETSAKTMQGIAEEESNAAKEEGTLTEMHDKTAVEGEEE